MKEGEPKEDSENVGEYVEIGKAIEEVRAYLRKVVEDMEVTEIAIKILSDKLMNWSNDKTRKVLATNKEILENLRAVKEELDLVLQKLEDADKRFMRLAKMANLDVKN